MRRYWRPAVRIVSSAGPTSEADNQASSIQTLLDATAAIRKETGPNPRNVLRSDFGAIQFGAGVSSSDMSSGAITQAKAQDWFGGRDVKGAEQCPPCASASKTRRSSSGPLQTVSIGVLLQIGFTESVVRAYRSIFPEAIFLMRAGSEDSRAKQGRRRHQPAMERWRRR
ncbi:MAG: hypothetical protein GC186_08690 [Rhodobacteraceae bacterium]|nr:hypothetical protein [Paracoccaceae bacterium]